MWDDLKAQVEVELRQLRRLLATHAALLAKCRSGVPSVDERAAVAAILHAFYTGIENIFKRIAMAFDGPSARGPFWHTELIQSMAAAAPKRPALLSPPLFEVLQDYLDFRHVFRQAYSFELRWDKMGHLALGMEEVLQRLQRETDAFFAQLGKAGPP